MNPNKFNIGDKVWFKLDSYGKKAERCGTICSSILCDPESGWQYNIETGDHKHWNIPEKDINYTAPHTRESDEKHVEESVKDFLNRIYGNPDFKPEVHTDAEDSLAYSIKRKLDGIRSNAVYGLNTDLTIEFKNGTHIFVNKEDNKMKNQQQKRNRNIIKTEKYQRTIKDITFNGPAVIVKFEPTGDDIVWGRTKGDKVVVVCKDGDKYDMKTGFLLAILKEFLNNQSYGNILEKLDSFDTFDIPQVGKDDVFKFKVGDIVRLKHGVARFKVDKCTTFTASSGKVVPRYRIVRLLGSKCSYSTYANENELVSADEVDHK